MRQIINDERPNQKAKYKTLNMNDKIKSLILLMLLIQLSHGYNLVFFIMDDMNSITSPIQSEFLNRMKNTSHKFTFAMSSVPLCLPSRSAILFGRPGYKTDIMTNLDSYIGSYPLDVSLPELLKNQGYHVGVYGKVFHETDQVKIIERSNITDYYFKPGDNLDNVTSFNGIKITKKLQIQNVSSGLCMDEITEIKSREYINKLNGDRPFALFYGTKKPHFPYIFKDTFQVNKSEINRLYNISLKYNLSIEPKNVNEKYAKMIGKRKYDFINGYYHASIMGFNTLERVYNNLESKSLLNNTIIVFISDHGFMTGYPDGFGKGNQYMMAVKKLMYISLPSRVNVKCKNTVSSVDMYYTLAKLMGLSLPYQNISKNNLLECKKTVSISSSLKTNYTDYSLFWKRYQYRASINDEFVFNENIYLKSDLYNERPLNNVNLMKKAKKILLDML
jgi:iduronate 2-sulfatase